MTTANSETAADHRPVYRRRWIMVGLSLILLFLVVLVLLPVGMGYGLKKWLLDNGAEQVALQDVDFNPFSGRLVLRGLQVSSDAKSTLTLPSLTLVMDWAPLWERRAQVRLLDVTGLKLDVLNSDEGMKLGGVNLPAAGQDTAAIDEMPGAPWGFALERLQIVESEVSYRDPKLETNAGIDRLTVRQLTSWLPEQPAMLDFEGNIAEASARVDGRLRAFAADPGFSGKLVLDGLSLETFTRLAQPLLRKLQGRFSIDSAFEIKQNQDGLIAFVQEGRLSLDELKASAHDGEYDVGQAAWNGRTTLDLPPAGQPVDLQLDGLFEQGVARVKLQEAGLSLQHQGLAWQGELGIAVQPQSTRVDAKGKLENKGLAMSLTDTKTGLKLQNQGLAWEGELGIELKSQSTRLEAKGALDNKGLVMSLSDADTGIESGAAHWSGNLQLDDNAERIQIESDGQLTLAQNRIETNGGADFVNLERVALTSDRLRFGQQKREGALELHHAGQLSIDQLNAQMRGDSLSKAHIQWQGDLLFSSAGERLQIETQGGLSSKGLRLALPRKDLLLQQDGGDWQGKLSYGLEGQQTLLSAAGTLTLGSLLLEAPEHKSSLLSFEQMKFEGIDILDLETFNIAEVSSKNLLLSRRGQEPQDSDTELPALIATARSSMNNIRFKKQDGLSVDLIEHENLQAVIRRFADGEVNVVRIVDLLVELMAGDQKSKAAQDTDTGKSAPQAIADAEKSPPQGVAGGLPVKVAKAALVGDSKLIFIDENVSPTYRTSIVFKQFEVTDIDSGDPTKDSPIHLKFAIGEDAELDLKGKVRFFDKKITAVVGGRVDGLALPPLSPYVAPALGYWINSGSLDADIDIKINQGKLDGSNQLKIYHLDVQVLTPEEKKQYQVKSTIPLETGLAMLRGKENSIELKLPISGDISSPKFGIADAINKAMANAMQQGARVYLAAALFPFGTMIAVAEIAGKSAMQVKLDPVTFSPASSELGSKAREYLEKLAKVLEERPALHMKVCGIAVEDDRKAMLEQAVAEVKKATDEARRTQQPKTDKAAEKPLPMVPQITDQQLKQLATQRGASVKNALRQTHGIKPSRLVVCDGKVETKAKQTEPRVELFL